MSKPRRLTSLLGTYPVTAPLKEGAVRSPLVEFDFADVAKPSSAFKRVVRNLEFEFSELALVTYLIALAHDKPLVLLPAVLFARFQHPYLVHDATRGALTPGDLAGKRIAVRSYPVTTVTWLRGMLEECGVDASRVTWLTTEEAHVAEFVDPPNVERAPAGKEIKAMLLAGEIDAAILAEPPKDGPLKTLIPDPAAAAAAWKAKNRAIQINHMVTLKNTVSKEEEKKIYELLLESRKAAGNPEMNPFGIEENRHNLEVAIDCTYRQGMIPRKFSVEELFR